MKQSKLLIMVAAFMMASTAAFAQMGTDRIYVITGGSPDVGMPSFTATRIDATHIATDGIISNVLDAIGNDCVTLIEDGILAFITFGDGGVLEIGTERATLRMANGMLRWRVGISGKISSAFGSYDGGTLVIGNGFTLTSDADIANTMGGAAISINGSSKVTITGGTITSAGNAIESNNGSVILGGSPTITGNIQVPPGALSVITAGSDAFNPAGKQYPITISGAAVAAGDVAVVGGKNFLSSFTLVNNPQFYLSASGNDLVLYYRPVPPGGDVTFDSQNGSPVARQQVPPGGGKVTKPADPTREGYTFGGWYREAACTNEWNFDNDVAYGNTTLYAKWTSTTAITHRTAAAPRLEVEQSGASLRIVGTSQAAPVRIYDMRGKLLMSRQALPNERISVSHLARGTYVVKALGKSIKLVR